MTLELWALFVATEAVLCLQPGPGVLLVVSQALAGGTRRGLGAVAGILTANALWFAASAGGLGALIASGGPAFSVVRLCGAAYLVVLGARQLFGPGKPSERKQVVSGAGSSGRTSYARGFLVQGTNPSLLVYFGSILPQFVDPSGHVPLQIGILALSSFAIEACVLGAYALLAGHAGRLSGGPRFQAILARVGGALLILVGAGLATLRTL